MNKLQKPKIIPATLLRDFAVWEIRAFLNGHEYIKVTYWNEEGQGFEIHPPGTGERLAELQRQANDQSHH